MSPRIRLDGYDCVPIVSIDGATGRTYVLIHKLPDMELYCKASALEDDVARYSMLSEVLVLIDHLDSDGYIEDKLLATGLIVDTGLTVSIGPEIVNRKLYRIAH